MLLRCPWPQTPHTPQALLLASHSGVTGDLLAQCQALMVMGRDHQQQQQQ